MKQHLISLYKSWLAARNLRTAYGHGKSTLRRKAVDAKGDPIPWFTYPATEFLSTLDFSTSRVFECGAGNSTLWWRKRAEVVRTVEHNPMYAIQYGVQFAPFPHLYMPEVGYDVLVIDGEWRKECAATLLNAVPRPHLVILDNSDWFAAAHAILSDIYPFIVHFNGFGPINAYTWTTSIYFIYLPPSLGLIPSKASVNP